MITRELHQDWQVRAVGEMPDEMPEALSRADVPAAVPGCVHTDLLSADLIPDPYIDQNELKLQWIGETDWQYSCIFEADPQVLERQQIELVCDGLDTIARIELNGVLIGETANMHVGYRFDVKDTLKRGRNELQITFSSANQYARAMEAEHGALPYLNTPVPFNFIRKMACNFGWDWGPVLVTAGIWRAIRLEGWDFGRIDTVRPLVMSADEKSAEVNLRIEVASTTGPLQLEATLTAPNGQEFQARQVVGQDEPLVELDLTVADPALWWPLGYGEQPLYDLTVTLSNNTGDELDRWQHKIGLRTTSLNTDEDEIGMKFVIEVNGQPIFCKGANWIPDDCFINRVDEDRYRQRIGQAIDANMNMLRVWGGGIYETEAFYEICDELGVMVWQDFLFACAAYPEEAPFDELVEAEAHYQTTRLSKHPSLVIWNGNNENVVGWWNWGWQEEIGERTWGAGFYFEMLPRILAERDPSRPYWPASPYSGSLDHNPDDNDHGNRHVWDAWFGGDYTVYRNHPSRFCSEFGFQGPPNYATLTQSIAPEELKQGSDGLAQRQKSPPGDHNNQRHLESFFESPEDFDDWHYLLQLNQARALTLGVEWFRSIQPRCMGTLYWQLNDCWPVVSWAAIDGYGRYKPMWYATRRFYAPRLLTFQPEDDAVILVANNDSPTKWEGQITLRRINFEGETLAETSHDLTAPARGTHRLTELDEKLVTPDDPTSELLIAECEGVRALWFFEIDKNLNYPAPDFDAELIQSDDDSTQYQLTITAKSLLRDLAVFVDRLDPDATISDQIITLLPGESVTFDIQTAANLDAKALTQPPVLQCTNRFGSD